MAEYDGSIRIGTGIETKEFKAGSKEIETEARRMAKSVSDSLGEGAKIALQKQTDAFVKMNQQYAAQEQKVKDLAAKLHDMQRQKVETPIFKETSKELESTEKKLDNLYGTLRRLEHAGKIDTAPYQNAITQIDIYKEKISDLKRDLKDLENSGEAYVPVDTSKVQKELTAAEQKQMQLYSALQTAADSLSQKTSERVEKEEAVREKIAAEAAEEERLDQIRVNAVATNDQIIAKVERLKQLEKEIADLKAAGTTEGYADYDNRIIEADQLKQDIRDYRDSLSEVPEKFSRMREAAKKAFNAISTGLSTIGKIGKKAFSGIFSIAKKMFSSITSGTKKSNGLFSTFASRLKGIALSLLIFNWISKGFNAMISGMKKGFENLAGYSDSYAQSVQNMKNAMSTFGNQFAAAFAPIVQMVIPWLTQLINTISKAMTYVSQFFAVLGGKSTFTKAKQVQDEYNKSLGGTAKAADKARGALAKFDDLDVLEKQEDTSGGGGDSDNTGEDMFEEAPIESQFEELAEKAKEVLSQLFVPLKEAWESQGEFVMESWRYALEEIGLLAKSVGKDFLEVWNQPETISVLENILIIAGDIGLVAGNLAARFREAWEANDVGLSILENIRNLFGIIIEHVRNAADATVEWSKNLDFSPMLESINGLLEALQPLADNIGAGLEWFYTNVLLPIAGWTIEDAVPAFLDMLSAAIETANEVIEALKPLGQWLWDEFLQPLGEWAGEAVIFAMETITDLLKKFGDWVSEHQEVINGFAITLGVLFSASMAADILSAAASLGEYIINAGGLVAVLKSTTASLVANTAAWFSNIAAKIADKAETLAIIALYAKDFIVNLAKGTAELVKQAAQFAISTAAKIADTAAQVAMTAATVAWNAVCALATAATTAFGAAVAFLTSPIGIAIVAIGAIIAIGVLLYKNWDTIKEKAKEVWDFVKKKFEEFSTWLKGIFEKDWTESFGAIGEVLNVFFDTIGEVWDSIKDIFGGIIDFLTGVFTGDWEKAWDGVTKIFDGIAGVIGGIVDGIIGVIKTVIEAIQGAIQKIKEFFSESSKASATGPVGGAFSSISGMSSNSTNSARSVSGYSMADIPHLATGSVIRGGNPFMAILGDQPRGQVNVEAPLDTIKQAVREELSGMNFGNAGVGQAKVVLNINGVDVGEAMLDDLFSVMQRRGYDVSVLGVR